MRRRKIITLYLAAVVLCGGTIMVWYLARRGGPAVSGSITHEAYVWQRRWNAPLKHAIARSQETLAGYTVLGAEIEWPDGKSRVVRVRVDHQSLHTTGRPVGVAMRINPYRGAIAADDEVGLMLVTTAKNLVTDARDKGLTWSELQIDFDCPTSRLDEYRVWLDAIKQAVAPLPVTITILPTWLRSSAFARLTDSIDGYVLQAHGLQKPSTPGQNVVLCDPNMTRSWVRRAGRLGVPFRVALPTYGYVFGFSQSGRYLGLAAEGRMPDWPADTTLQVVTSDASAMKRLISQWQHARPAAMQGVIWYRLPLETDQRNWSWQTLQAVMAQGATPGGPDAPGM